MTKILFYVKVFLYYVLLIPCKLVITITDLLTTILDIIRGITTGIAIGASRLIGYRIAEGIFTTFKEIFTENRKECTETICRLSKKIAGL